MTRRILRHPLCLVGLIIIGLLALASAGATWLAPADPLQQNLTLQLAPPMPGHPLGTDELGRDLLSRILYGGRTSIPIGFAVVGIAMAIGIAVGAVAGFWGGWVDEVLMRGTDLVLAFPALILAMAIAGALGPSLWHALIALSIAWWPPYARLVRSQVLTVKEMPYVEASRCMGASRIWILTHHVLPNCLAPVVVQATLDLGSVILTAAGLSFIGLGQQPPLPEWGSMVNSGRLYLATQPWVSAFPGLAILLAVVGFNLFGDGLRDVMDPRLRRSG
ncbi:MAG: nickel transporter permease [Candidatus Xenobia bacterium]